MKGNEARVVFFLQPVDQFRDGEVAKVEKSFWSYFGFRSLLLLGLLLGLGFLAYVAYVLAQIEGPEPAVSTTTAPTTTTVTTTSTTTTANDNTTTVSPPSPTVPPTPLPGHEKQTKQADMLR